jgi:hypothetical protein
MLEFTGIKFIYLLIAIYAVVLVIALFRIKIDAKKPKPVQVYSFKWDVWVGYAILAGLAISLYIYIWAFSI